MADSVFLMGDHSNKPPVLFSEKLHKNALKMIEDWRLKRNTKMSKLIPFFETVVIDSLCNLAEMFLKGQTEVPGLNFEVAEYNIWALLYGGSGRTHLSFDGCGLETARLSDLARLRKFNKKALDRSNRTMDQLIDQARRRKPAEGFIQPSVAYYSIETEVPNGTKHIELEKSLVAAAYPKKLEVMVTRITNPSDLLKGINSLRTFIANNFATTNKAFSFVLNLMLYNWNEHYFTISERAKIELTNFAKKPKVDGSVVTVIAGKLGQNTITEEEITTLTDYVCSIKPKKEQAKLKEAINTLFGNQKSLSAGLAQDLAKQDKFGNRLLDLMLFGYSKQFLAHNFGSREQLVEEIHKLAPESLSPSAYIKDVALRWDGIKLVPSKTNSSGAKVRYEFNELQMFYLENQVFMTYIGLKGAPIAEERCYPADPREALAHLKALLKKIKPEQTDYEAGIYLKSLLKHHIDFSNTEWIGAFKEVNRHLYLESEFKTYFTSLENNILPLASTFRLVDYFFKVSKRVHPSDRKDDPETKRLKALLELSFKGITHLSAVLKQLSSETREKYLTWKNNPTAVGGRSNPKKGGNAPKPPTGMMDTNFILQLLLHFSLFGDRDFIKSVLSNSYYKLPTDKLNPDEFTRFDILLYDHAADLVAISNNQAEAELKYAQLVSSKILNMILSQSGDLLVGGLALAADADQNFSSKVKLSRLQNQAMISRLAISNNRLRSMHPKSNQTQLLNTLHNVARLVKRLGGAKGNANFEAFISDVYLVALSEPAIPSKIGGQQKLKAACVSFLQVLQSEFGTVDTLEESSFKLTQMLRHFSSNIVYLIEYIVNTYKADDDFARDFCNFLFQRLESVIQEEEKRAQENERQPELLDRKST